MAPHRFGAGKVTPPRNVLLDSSFLIAVMEHPTPWREELVDLVGNFQPVVLQPVYQELSRLSASGRGRSRFAAAAVKFVDSSGMSVEAARGDRADDELISRALGEGALVATIDAGLIAQLKAAGVGVVSLRAGRVDLR